MANPLSHALAFIAARFEENERMLFKNRFTSQDKQLLINV
jgi:hypothetical protein